MFVRFSNREQNAVTSQVLFNLLLWLNVWLNFIIKNVNSV